MTSTTPKPKLPNNGVLFDEDYRFYIERLTAKLERERRAVLALREQVFGLQAELQAEIQRRKR